jgi:hypothetical protein
MAKVAAGSAWTVIESRGRNMAAAELQLEAMAVPWQAA